MKKLFFFAVVMLSLSKHNSSFAQAPHLWVTASSGGLYNAGTILESDSTGTNFQVVWNFNDPVGSFPTDNMVMAPNGKLYGTTVYGGYQDSCTIYEYDTTNNTCDSVYNFTYHTEFGSLSVGGLTLANNGKIYGVAGGGSGGYGVIFLFNPPNESYSDIHDFEFLTGASSLNGLVQFNDSSLYGITNSGGLNNKGVIFKINPETYTYSDEFDFTDSTNTPSYFCRLLKASDGKLYGVTSVGGSLNIGTMFSFDPVSKLFVRLHSFSGLDGNTPVGSLTQASDGKIYGVTKFGGNFNYGIMYSYDIQNNVYSVVYYFGTWYGFHPLRGLMSASNGLLFGTTGEGGSHGDGVVFSFDVISNTYSVVLNFENSVTGSNCLSEVSESSPHWAASSSNLHTKNNNLTIYPNPVSDYLTVQGLASNTKIEITDVAGRVLYHQNATSSAQIDMRGYLAGVYLLHCGGVVRKIIKL